MNCPSITHHKNHALPKHQQLCKADWLTVQVVKGAKGVKVAYEAAVGGACGQDTRHVKGGTVQRGHAAKLYRTKEQRTKDMPDREDKGKKNSNEGEVGEEDLSPNRDATSPSRHATITKLLPNH